MNYKQSIYYYYRSMFKGVATDESLRFGADKIRPLLQPWVTNLNQALPIVDLGCGTGEVLLALKDLGFKTLAGCDLSAEQVAVAYRMFPNVVESDLFVFLNSQTDSSLELITLFDVIEHLTKQESFDLMTLIYKKLRPGGHFIAHLPNGLSPFVGHVFWGDISHEWCMTPQSAKTICFIHGLEAFEAVEHIGASKTIKGTLRSIAWAIIRKGMQFINYVETGSSGGSVWTRNFAFKAQKPLQR